MIHAISKPIKIFRGPEKNLMLLSSNSHTCRILGLYFFTIFTRTAITTVGG
jgi:hypothetical protein